MNKSLEEMFNEDEYLALNEDVAAAVRSGTIPSGRYHFETIGFAEGRAFFSKAYANNAGLRASLNFFFDSTFTKSGIFSNDEK